MNPLDVFTDKFKKKTPDEIMQKFAQISIKLNDPIFREVLEMIVDLRDNLDSERNNVGVITDVNKDAFNVLTGQRMALNNLLIRIHTGVRKYDEYIKQKKEELDNG